VADGDPNDLYDGGFPAWALPPDETGARFARSVVKAVFGALGLPPGVTYDTAVALSELATNVHRHARDGTPPYATPPYATPPYATPLDATRRPRGRRTPGRPAPATRRVPPGDPSCGRT
jgi:hypothetical protein